MRLIFGSHISFPQQNVGIDKQHQRPPNDFIRSKWLVRHGLSKTEQFNMRFIKPKFISATKITHLPMCFYRNNKTILKQHHEVEWEYWIWCMLYTLQEFTVRYTLLFYSSTIIFLWYIFCRGRLQSKFTFNQMC